MVSGIVGGELGYRLIRRIAGSPPRRNNCSGAAYLTRNKLDVLFGPDIWGRLADRVVLDFGCGSGDEAIQIAQRGARHVIGLDIRERVLAEGRTKADAAGVADRCTFTSTPDQKADVVISSDAFEHFSDPAGILAQMGALLTPGGEILVAFGSTWFHPYGGHLFSIFPWAHLVFSEAAFMRWWAEFKTDGARRFHDIEGGLNGMTVKRFSTLVQRAGYQVELFETIPIRKAKRLHNRFTREFTTSLIRCRLRVRA